MGHVLSFSLTSVLPCLLSAAPPPSPPAPLKAIDAAQVATITGAKPELAGAVVRVSFPRTDVPVEVDGWKAMPPFMGLTSWAAFTPGEKPGVEAMVMGDLVLFEDEVNPVISAAFENGLDVTALHNHFFYAAPQVLFMHISGEGTVDKLARGLRAALDAEQELRRKFPHPRSGFGAGPLPPNAIDGPKLDAIFGLKGTSKDGMYKVVAGRAASAACGCSIGKAMGVSTWAALGGSDSDAVVDGDFSVTEAELQPVLRSLRAGGINVVAIHSHMTGETPRLLFVHFWGRSSAEGLARVIKRTLELTAYEGRTQTQ